MSTWTERFAAHPVHETLRQLQEELTAAQTRAEGDASHMEQADRIVQVVGEVSRRLAAVDPNLFYPPALDNFNGPLLQVSELVRKFNAADGDDAALEHANATVDSMLSLMHQLSPPRTTDDVTAIGDAIVTFRRSVAQHARYASEQLQKLGGEITVVKDGLATVTADLTNQKTRVDTFISQAEQRIATAEGERAARFTGAEAAQAEQVQTAIRQLAEQYAAAEQKRSEAFTALVEKMQGSVKEIVDAGKVSETARAEAASAAVAALAKKAEDSKSMFADLHEEIDSAARDERTKLQESARQTLSILDAEKTRASELIGIIANTGMAGGYQIVANEERAAARWWSALAVTCMSGFVSFAVYAFFHAKADSGFDWGAFAAKFYASVAFGVFATYAATQAAKHQRNERRSRAYQLEHASLDLYLASLPEAERHKIKQSLAERLFGQVDDDTPEPTQPVTAKSLFDLLSEILRTLSKKGAKD